MSITRRILGGSKGDTFIYKEKEYAISDLVAFCKDKPVEEVKLSTFRQLGKGGTMDDLWTILNDSTGKITSPTVIEIARQVKRVKDADTSKPIIVLKENGKMRVLDGIHRLAKAYMDKKKTIPTIYLTSEDMVEFTTGS